ncbi:MAG TPA: hypothetical protein PKG81_05210, partial [Candidatus Omnitrophota bacterium]|nr:hypothetical protein [Candidatus Omnitrophota bacterium]
ETAVRGLSSRINQLNTAVNRTSRQMNNLDTAYYGSAVTGRALGFRVLLQRLKLAREARYMQKLAMRAGNSLSFQTCLDMVFADKMESLAKSRESAKKKSVSYGKLLNRVTGSATEEKESEDEIAKRKDTARAIKMALSSVRGEKESALNELADMVDQSSKNNEPLMARDIVKDLMEVALNGYSSSEAAVGEKNMKMETEAPETFTEDGSLEGETLTSDKQTVETETLSEMIAAKIEEQGVGAFETAAPKKAVAVAEAGQVSSSLGEIWNSIKSQIRALLVNIGAKTNNINIQIISADKVLNITTEKQRMQFAAFIKHMIAANSLSSQYGNMSRTVIACENQTQADDVSLALTSMNIDLNANNVVVRVIGQQTSKADLLGSSIGADMNATISVTGIVGTNTAQSLYDLIVNLSDSVIITDGSFVAVTILVISQILSNKQSAITTYGAAAVAKMQSEVKRGTKFTAVNSVSETDSDKETEESVLADIYSETQF